MPAGHLSPFLYARAGGMVQNGDIHAATPPVVSRFPNLDQAIRGWRPQTSDLRA